MNKFNKIMKKIQNPIILVSITKKYKMKNKAKYKIAIFQFKKRKKLYFELY